MANQHRLSVLIVEQDEESQLQLKEIMAGQDYGVTCISEPLRAPEEVRQNRYQLIFLDVVEEAIRDRGLLVDLETHLNSEVGRRIRTQRHESELTLKQLANRTGLSVSLISQIELGKSAASMSTIHKLAAALGVKITYFFETL